MFFYHHIALSQVLGIVSVKRQGAVVFFVSLGKVLLTAFISLLIYYIKALFPLLRYTKLLKWPILNWST
jgi:hypothetical protein